jgi:hypothetical protein
MAEMAQTYQISRAFLDQLIWVAQHHLQDLFSPRLARRHHELTQYQHRARKARLEFLFPLRHLLPPRRISHVRPPGRRAVAERQDPKDPALFSNRSVTQEGRLPHATVKS